MKLFSIGLFFLMAGFLFAEGANSEEEMSTDDQRKVTTEQMYELLIPIEMGVWGPQKDGQSLNMFSLPGAVRPSKSAYNSAITGNVITGIGIGVLVIGVSGFFIEGLSSEGKAPNLVGIATISGISLGTALIGSLVSQCAIPEYNAYVEEYNAQFK